MYDDAECSSRSRSDDLQGILCDPEMKNVPVVGRIVGLSAAELCILARNASLSEQDARSNPDAHRNLRTRAAC